MSRRITDAAFKKAIIGICGKPPKGCKIIVSSDDDDFVANVMFSGPNRDLPSAKEYSARIGALLECVKVSESMKGTQ